MINESNLKSITVLIMQVPCCSGLAQLALDAVNSAETKIPINYIVLGINGEILKEEQIA
ncbi:MAG: hypothetical protein HY963_02640 [Ignavibacteriales bacterium]|nr:hypothetical protein [Ignavibacteriales bacterium]